MSFSKPVLSAAAVGALALVTACSSTPSYHETRVYEAPTGNAPVYGDYGQVTSIEMIPVSARPSGAGIVGGAVAGNAIENRNKRDDEVYRVWIRLDNGTMRSLDFHRVDDLRVGDRVRYEGGQLYRY